MMIDDQSPPGSWAAELERRGANTPITSDRQYHHQGDLREIERLRRELAEARKLLRKADPLEHCATGCDYCTQVSSEIATFLASDQPAAVQCRTCDGEGYVVNYRPGQAHAPKPCPDCTPDKSSD